MMADLALDAIRERHDKAPRRGPHLDGGEAAHYDRGVLLAEVARLTESLRLIATDGCCVSCISRQAARALREGSDG
jgi:hypothetical protein